LRARGHDVTQATLSRDLAKLQARRVSLPSGGTAYEIDGFAARTGGERSQARAPRSW
jgi:transcriptional regulator of arginine metabolism